MYQDQDMLLAGFQMLLFMANCLCTIGYTIAFPDQTEFAFLTCQKMEKFLFAFDSFYQIKLIQSA